MLLAGVVPTFTVTPTHHLHLPAGNNRIQEVLVSSTGAITSVNPNRVTGLTNPVSVACSKKYFCVAEQSAVAGENGRGHSDDGGWM
jgi:hypothetical protein